MKVVADYKNVSIRNQMMTMFLIVILPMFAASIILLLNFRSITRDNTINSVLTEADGVKYRIYDMVEDTESSMELLTANKTMISFLDNSFTDSSDYYRYYSSNSNTVYLRAAPQLDRFFIFTERDDFIFSSGYYKITDNIKNSSWYISACEYPDDYIWDVIRSPADNKDYLCCAKAIENDSRIVGVAVAAVSDKWFERYSVNDEFELILSVNKGNVYYSNYEKIEKGYVLESDSEINTDLNTPNIRKCYDNGIDEYKGYTALETFYINNPFQIIMLVPKGYVNSEFNRISIIYGGYCGLTIILSILIVILFTSVFSRRITQLSEKMHMVAGGNFDVEFFDKGDDEISVLYNDLSQMIKSMQKLMADVYNAKLQNEAFKLSQMEAEFKALSSQINPHFLYNTLETIRMKAYCNNDKETAELVKKLGKFMRRCLEFKDGEVTLRSELEFTNGYLELQSARFGDKVSYSIYSEVSKDYMILPLIIQPVVENAFVHGIERSKSNGRIEVKVYYKKDLVVIDVSDNGVGITPEKLNELENKLALNDTSSGKSIGLTNVNKRIKMYHGDEYGMSIHSVPGQGTTIRITLPREPVKRASGDIDNDKKNKAV